MARYRLTARSYIDGRIWERGEVVTLPAFQSPGPHMVLEREPIVVPPDVVKTDPAPPIALRPAPVVPVEALQPVVEPDADAVFLDHMTSSRGPGYLVIDTETNGFSDPRVAAIALLFVDDAMAIEHEYSALIRPDGWDMDPRATAVNGLTTNRLSAEGIPIIAPLHVWTVALATGRTLVAHNLAFDTGVMANEMVKAGLSPPNVRRSICTMQTSRKIGVRGTLAQTHSVLCGSEFDGAHDAAADARACLAVLRALSRKGAL